MPVCPYCGCCTVPVWAMRYTFQCDCGWSGEMQDARLQAIFRPIWEGIMREDGNGDAN